MKRNDIQERMGSKFEKILTVPYKILKGNICMSEMLMNGSKKKIIRGASKNRDQNEFLISCFVPN